MANSFSRLFIFINIFLFSWLCNCVCWKVGVCAKCVSEVPSMLGKYTKHLEILAVSCKHEGVCIQVHFV